MIISLGMVGMISVRWFSRHMAGSTREAFSWSLDHWIGIIYSRRMMMMGTWWLPQRWALNRPLLVMVTMARVRRTRRAVRKGPGNVWKQRMRRGQGKLLRTGRGKGSGWGRETVKWNVLWIKPQEMIISLMPLLCTNRLAHGGRTRVRTFRAGSNACRDKFLRWWHQL